MRVSCGDPLEDHKNAKCSHHAMWQLPVPVQRLVDGAGADGDCLEVGGSTMATAAATATGETLAACRMTHLLD